MKILVAIKRTKYERDIIRYGSEEAVQRLYHLQNDAFLHVYASHERQLLSLEKIKRALPDAVFARREELERIDFSQFDLIVSLGGDNHFVYVSHFALHRPIAGINSDPQTSSGVLLNFDTDQFISSIENAQSSDLKTEKWSCIEGELTYPNGDKLSTGVSLSEISIRNTFPDAMSRYLIKLNENPFEEQKSSGMLLATGVGSTGWFRNAVPEQLRDSCRFNKAADFFRYVARESELRNYSLSYGTVNGDETLEMVSEMDGKITIDASPFRVFEFPPGCTVKFGLSAAKIRVVKQIGSDR